MIFSCSTATDYDAAYSEFEWPRPETFNFATDWFDGVLAAEHPDRIALQLIEEDGQRGVLHLR